MAQQANINDHGVKFAGTVYVRKLGTKNWYDLGNTTSLKITLSGDKDERISHRRDTVGQALDSLYTPKPAEISWDNDTFNRQNFANMLMGEAANLSGAAQQITDEAIELLPHEWVELGQRNLDENTPLTFKTKDDQPLNLAGKVEINHRLGLIRLNEGNKTEAKVSYATRENKGFAIDAATLTSLELELRVDGLNRATGENSVLSVWHASVTANDGMDWLSGDWGKASFSGTCVTPSDKNSPFRLEVLG